MPGIDSAAPERTLTSSGSAGSPNFLPTSVLHLLDGRLDLRPDRLGQLAAVLVVGGADLGGDREARGDRDADDAHLGQVGPLAAEQVLHVGLAVGLAAAERINILGRFRHRGCKLLVRVSPSARRPAADASRLARAGRVRIRNLIKGQRLTSEKQSVKGAGRARVGGGEVGGSGRRAPIA